MSGPLRIGQRRWNAGDDGFQHFLNADSLLGGRQNDFLALAADQVADCFGDFLRLGVRQVDLVDDRNDFQVVVQRLVEIRQRLRFDSLRGIDDQQRALTSGNRAGDFVGEIDMSGGVDQIEDVVLSCRRRDISSGWRAT